MKANKQFLAWFIPAAFLFAAGFAVAAFYDLSISQQLYNPENPFAIWIECFGWYPAFIPPLVLAMLYLPRHKNTKLAKDTWQTSMAAAVLLIGSASLVFVSYRYMNGRGWAESFADPRCWFWLATVFVPLTILCFFVFRMPPATILKLRFWALFGTAYLLANQACVNIIKQLWQRTRFDTMLTSGQGFESFTPWYHPFGNGGSSFPSGHTANAAGILMLIILCDLFQFWFRRRALVYTLAWGYIAATGFARIQIGRHFLSDTLASAVIMGILIYALRNNRFYLKLLDKTLHHAEGFHGI